MYYGWNLQILVSNVGPEPFITSRMLDRSTKTSTVKLSGAIHYKFRDGVPERAPQIRYIDQQGGHSEWLATRMYRLGRCRRLLLMIVAICAISVAALSKSTLDVVLLLDTSWTVECTEQEAYSCKDVEKQGGRKDVPEADGLQCSAMSLDRDNK